jgi:protein ImuB
MARTLCVWYPDWPLRRPDAPSDRPSQIVDDSGIVVAADVAASAAGVRPGMRRREAEALCPAAVTLISDSGAEAVAFEPIALAVEHLIPRVEIAHPGLLFVPIAGAVRYYGGELALAARVEVELGRITATGAHLGVADGPFGARMAAAQAAAAPVLVDDTVRFLAGLDVSVVGIDEIVDTFRWLGITTLGDLSQLPRAAIASRFGPQGLAAHRVASGEDRHVSPRTVPEGFAVEDRFDPPLEDLERGAFAARNLALRLLDGLMPRGGMPYLVEVEATSTDGDVRSRTWRSSHPFSEAELAERIRWQLRAWVESGGIPGGIRLLRVIPGDLSDGGRQLRLDEDVSSQEDARRALIRTQALVGPDAVLKATPQGGRDPAERITWYRWGEEPGAPTLDPAAPWPGAVPGPMPALATRTRITIEWEGGFPVRVRLGSRWEPVLSWAGPWRRTGRWWEGQPAADRYQVVTSAGAFLCEVAGEEAYVTGVYD